LKKLPNAESACEQPSFDGKKISCPGETVREPGARCEDAPAFSRAKNWTRRASGAVTSTTLVVTVSTCLAFRSGGGCRRLAQAASDGRRTTQLCEFDGKPDRCDRGSLLEKNFRLLHLRGGRPLERPPLTVRATRSHASQSKLE